MAGQKKHNKKLPKDGVSDKKKEPKYGYVHGEADACGGTRLVYRNPAEYKKTWSVNLSPSCNYKTIEHDEDDNELMTNLNPGHTRKYTAKGASEQYDTQRDIGVEKTNLVQAGGDGGCVIKGDRYNATGGNVIKGNGAGGKFEGLMGSSDTKDMKVVKGDTVQKNTGSIHTNREGDQISAITGTMISMIKEGDFAVNVQGGNWDNVISDKSRIKTGKCMIFQTGDKDVKPPKDSSMALFSANKTNMSSTDEMGISSGKAMSVASQDTMAVASKKDLSIGSDAKISVNGKGEVTISSDQKITLKVGGSSITISKDGIDIKSDGDVTTKGSTTKVQGGGNPGLPTTFK